MIMSDESISQNNVLKCYKINHKKRLLYFEQHKYIWLTYIHDQMYSKISSRARQIARMVTSVHAMFTQRGFWDTKLRARKSIKTP